jgi:hypothetical protein
MKPRRRKPRLPQTDWLAVVKLLAGRPEAEAKQVQYLSPDKVPAAAGQRSCKR